MLVLAALILAAPPALKAVEPAAIAFRLADTAPDGRIELLKEFSSLWPSAPWGPKAKAASTTGQADLPTPNLASRPMGQLVGLGLSLRAPMPPLLVVAQLGWRLLETPITRPAESTWVVDDAPDMQQLRAEVRRDDRYAHAQNLIDLARGHQRRGELDAARAQLGEALAVLRRTPDVEFDANAWDDAQTLCLQLGDFPTALSLPQLRAEGGLEALDGLVDFAFEFDHADQVLAAVPVLFALKPGIDDVLPDPPAGCVDAVHPQRRAKLADWSERLLSDGYVRLNQALLQATPDVVIREALRATTIENLLLDQRYDTAWAVFAQMGLETHELKLGPCAEVEAPEALRRTARLAIVESGTDFDLPALVLKAVESAFETGELSDMQWDAVNFTLEERFEVPALAAIMGKARATSSARATQVEWAEMMLLSGDEQSIYAVRSTLRRLLTDPEQVAEIDEAISSANADMADADNPYDDVVLPEERWPEDLRLAKIYAARGDSIHGRAAVARVWRTLRDLPDGDVANKDWMAWARLSLLFENGVGAVELAQHLPTEKTRIEALRALGETALDLWQDDVSVAAARVLARAVTKQPSPAQKPDAQRCTSPADAVIEQISEPWLTGWVDRNRFDVALQITRGLPTHIANRRLAHLIVRMARASRFTQALALAPDVIATAPCVGDDAPRDVAWLGLIDEALNNRRFEVARRAVIAMPTAPIDTQRFASLMQRLFDGLAETERMPDLSPVLGRSDVAPAVKAIVRGEMVRQHLAHGRVRTALMIGRESDRRTRMRVLLALAGEDEARLAEHAAAIRDLGR